MPPTGFMTRSLAGDPFGDTSSGQVAENIGLGEGAEFIDGSTQSHESVPYGSSGAYDWYQRPIYRDMTFENVRIPMGTNALFENCRFLGVTWIETEEVCGDPNWNYTGSIEPDGNGGFQPIGSRP